MRSGEEEILHPLDPRYLERFQKELEIKAKIPQRPEKESQKAEEVQGEGEDFAIREATFLRKPEEVAEFRKVVARFKEGDRISPKEGGLSGFSGVVVKSDVERGIVLIKFGRRYIWQPGSFF